MRTNLKTNGLTIFHFSFVENDVCEIFNGIKQDDIKCSSRLFMLDE